MPLERDYQSGLIKRIRELLPGCFILKNDEQYLQGIPDLTILYGDKWAMLEVKKSRSASHRPNQDHYVAQLNDLGFAAFIYPENESEVLDALQRSLSA